MYIYRVSNVYLSYIFRVYIEIYSGLQAAKVQLFCDICKRKGHFLSKKGKKNAKNDDNPEGVAKKMKKMHFFVGAFEQYLRNSYFLVSNSLSRAFLHISKKVSTFALAFGKWIAKTIPLR